MPPTRRYVRKPRKVVKRRYRRKTKTTTINRGLAPISDRFVTKLKYCDKIAQSVTGGIMADYSFRMNSLFDPDLSGTGHQPYGFDQLATFYNRYRVYKIDYTIIQQPNASNTGTLVVIPSNGIGSFAGQPVNYLQEMNRAISKIVSIDMPTVIRGSVYLPKLNGDPSVRYKTDDRFQAAVTTNPIEELILHVCPSMTNTTTVTFDVRFIFHCEFFDPKVLPQS